MEDVEIAWLRCERCDTITSHNQQFSIESDVEIRDVESYLFREFAIYRLFLCGRCMGISLFLWSPFHDPGSEFGESVYPPRRNDWSGIPESVRVAYLEAEKVKYHSTIAYVILARRVLAVIARERGITDRSLAQALTRLASEGYVPPSLIEAAALIRSFGNIGAHSIADELDGMHVAMIETFLPALMEHLYVIPSSLIAFKHILGIETDDS